MGNLGLLSKSVFLLEKEIDQLNSSLGLTGYQIGSDRVQFFSRSPRKVKTLKHIPVVNLKSKTPSFIGSSSIPTLVPLLARSIFFDSPSTIFFDFTILNFGFQFISRFESLNLFGGTRDLRVRHDDFQPKKVICDFLLSK